MNAEQIIANTLNGWFFSLNLWTGKVSVDKVPLDYIPDHSSQGWVITDDGMRKNNNGQAFPWTPEQDEQLLKMRAAGATWPAIGAVFGCSNKTVFCRHAKLMRGEI